MSQAAVESLLGRIITDDSFRSKAMASLENACSGAGLTLSAEEMSCLKDLDYTLFQRISEDVDASVRRT